MILSKPSVNLTALISILLIGCSQSESLEDIKITYPETRMGDVVDTYFGVEVPDPYRWLEDDLSNETGDWVKAQNEVTAGYLTQIPYRAELKERLENLWDYEKETEPFREGRFHLFLS